MPIRNGYFRVIAVKSFCGYLQFVQCGDILTMVLSGYSLINVFLLKFI